MDIDVSPVYTPSLSFYITVDYAFTYFTFLILKTLETMTLYLPR
jgi:hypothetical protein